jgi:hypothetical protein
LDQKHFENSEIVSVEYFGKIIEMEQLMLVQENDIRYFVLVIVEKVE